MGRSPAELSRKSETSVRLTGRRVAAPWKITSSIFPPRSSRADCSPSTQRTASDTLDLPQPLGPTIAVTPSSKVRSTVSANDLKPDSSSLVSFMRGSPRCEGGESPGGRVRRADHEVRHAERAPARLGLFTRRIGAEHDAVGFALTAGRQHRGLEAGLCQLAGQLPRPLGIARAAHLQKDAFARR